MLHAGRKGYWDIRVGAAEWSHKSARLKVQVVRYYADDVASTSHVEGLKLACDRGSASNSRFQRQLVAYATSVQLAVVRFLYDIVTILMTDTGGAALWSAEGNILSNLSHLCSRR